MIDGTSGAAEATQIAKLIVTLFGSTLALLWGIDLIQSFLEDISSSREIRPTDVEEV